MNLFDDMKIEDEHAVTFLLPVSLILVNEFFGFIKPEGFF